MKELNMDILLANPRGFCAGVERAIEIVERALEIYGAPIYVRHEVVHNKFVVDDLRTKGAVFVEELDEVPDGATVIFCAHGVSKAVRAEADRRGLRVFDATCPLVTKVHSEVGRVREAGKEIVMIGHRGYPGGRGHHGTGLPGHALVENVEDVARLQVKDPNQLAYVTQTTLSVDDARTIVRRWRRVFRRSPGPGGTISAMPRRTARTRSSNWPASAISSSSWVPPNSSNSNRLREVAMNRGVKAYLVDGADEIRPEWLSVKQHVGVTAGASAPEVLVRQVVDRVTEMGARSVIQLEGNPEHIVFPLPKELQRNGE
ncbi:MAG: 4-hydroxy-3-methylbut-2-enyl diphosphate reductase [Rhodocyclaceae bacterium]|nr:4-hydroxy-3-methylbut-2-enyl diphosphate reductase [Rhodocyclaceae bacterium]